MSLDEIGVLEDEQPDEVAHGDTQTYLEQQLGSVPQQLPSPSTHVRPRNLTTPHCLTL